MRWTCLMLAAASLAACSGPQDLPDPPLKLYVFDCGRLRYDSPESSGFGVPDADTSVRELVVPCYVIDHAKGRLLWDGGLASSVAGKRGWHEMEGWALRLDRSLANQLGGIGLDMSSFDFVAFSHMHFDHVGVANEIENATVLIQRAEHEAAFAADVTVPGFDRALYEGLASLPVELLDGEHDVFGDGRVRILPTPGHTPGHQVLFVDLQRTGPVVLSGDLYHFRLSRERRIVPEFNVSAEQTLGSMDRIEAFVHEAGAELWIGHDLARFEQLDKAPGWYD